MTLISLHGWRLILPLQFFGKAPVSITDSVINDCSFWNSRRRFLRQIAATGAAAALGRNRWPGSEGNAQGWYAWLADPHIGRDRSDRLHGQAMCENLETIVAEIRSAGDAPRGVMVDGDLALDRGSNAEYMTFLHAVRPLLADRMPLHIALGNHDDRYQLQRSLGSALGVRVNPTLMKSVATVEGGDLRHVLLDSLDQPTVTGGELGEGQLTWLATGLDEDPVTPTIVFVHHNLDPDRRSALHDTEKLLEVLRPRRQVKAVVFGHTHAWGVQLIDGIYAINLPAVGYKFKRSEPLGWCVFRPGLEGGELELMCIGRDRSRPRERLELKWRTNRGLA